MDANLDAANLTNAEFRFGSDDRAVKAQGDTTLKYGSSALLLIKAKATQANVDLLLRRRGEDGVPPERAIAFLTTALGSALARVSDLNVEADVTAVDVILGSETMSNLSAKVNAEPGEPLKTHFAISLPGASRFRADGDLETGSAPKFQGAIDFSTDDFPLLRDWASKGAPHFAARASELGDAFAIRKASISGDVEVSSVGFSGRTLKLRLDRSALTGSLAITDLVRSNPKLYMDVSSDLLDIATLPTLSASQTIFGDFDLSIALHAKALHVSHVGEGGIDSGSLAFKIERSGPKATLKQLSIADLGGASFEAKGSLGPEGAEATGHLDAVKLRDFALLISRLAPSDWSKALAERASLLSPTSLAFELRGNSAPDRSPELNSLRVDGSIGQTRADFTIDPARDGKSQTVALDLDAVEAGALLRQLGIVGTAGSIGPAHIALRATGAWAAAYDVEAIGTLAGADASANGRFVPTAEGDEARLFGSAKFNCVNVIPLASALGLAPPGGGTIGPVEGGADVTLRGERWTVSRLSAKIEGIRTNGELAYERPAKAAVALLANPDLALAEDAINGPSAAANQASLPAVTGELSFDRLPLASLIALALGPQQPTKPGSLWPGSKFAPLPLNPPPIAVRVSAQTLDAGGGFSAQGFSTTLHLGNGRLDLDDMAMKIAEGEASGSVTFRRDRDGATLSGTMSAKRLVINGDGFSGRIGGTVEFASTR